MRLLPKITVVSFLFFGAGVLCAQSVSGKVEKHLAGLTSMGELTHSDTQFNIESEHVSSISGVHHIYFEQTINGIPVDGTSSSVHFLNGEPLETHSLQFVRNAASKMQQSANPSVTALSAVKAAFSKLNISPRLTLVLVTQDAGPEQATIISRGGIMAKEIEVRLRFIAADDDLLKLIWEFELVEPDYLKVWLVQVDATTGEVLHLENTVDTCNFGSHDEHPEETLNYNFNVYPPSDNKEESAEMGCSECYEVFEMPFESPYDGERTIVQSPAHPVGSPYGWHDLNGQPGADNTYTTGNNTETFESGDNSGFQPWGGTDLNFTGFPFGDEWTTGAQYEDAAVTNLFYWVNLYHDIFYIYGFDESAGNFQWNNYGNGGIGGDFIFAQSQSSEWCNAAYYTPVDGEPARMSVYICGSRDGSFDSTVIAHELTHGLQRRLVGGPNNRNCRASEERVDEGLCDWYAAVLTIKPFDNGADPKGIANYLFDYGIDGPGIRLYPYSTDMNVNPLTYGDTQELEPLHWIGSIFGNVLWEMTWALIEEYGFDPNVYNFTGKVDQDAGNIQALAIVTEALKLVECKGGFVDYRDAVLRANRLIYGGRSECLIWTAFSKRGLGFGASQGSPESNADNWESFDMIPMEASLGGLFDMCLSSPILHQQYGGNPYGGVYSGPGVTDNGDGLTYTFNPAEAGIGTHTITYTIEETDCTIPSSDSVEVTIFEDLEPPTIICPTWFSVPVEDFQGYFEAPSLVPFVTATDDCTPSPTITQFPELGTLISKNESDLVITLTALDEAGNEESCDVPIFLTLIEPDGALEIQLHPNPTDGTVFIRKRTLEKIEQTDIFDVHGRLVKSYNLERTEADTQLNIESLTTGIYFIRFELESEVVVKQIIKK